MHSLAVPYADTRAEELTLALGEPELPALARREWRVGDIEISLRLLGASHQVVVTSSAASFARSDATPFSETVACLPGRRADLPTTLLDGSYRFDAEITTHTDESMTMVVDDLATRAERADAAGTPALIGRFPRHPLAVTALFAQIHGTVVSWQTWHVYPQSGEVVGTRSELDCAA